MLASLFTVLATCQRGGMHCTTAHARAMPFININPDTQVGNPPSPGQWMGFDENFPANTTQGWTFHVNQNLLITQIGYYDRGGDGLMMPHTVELWSDLSGSYFQPGLGWTPILVTKQTIPAGTAAALSGVWRVVDLPTPITLVPGGYQLLAPQPVASTNTDVVKYVLDYGAPGPSNSHVSVRRFIWNGPGTTGPFPQTYFYAEAGMELGAMLMTDQIPEPAVGLAVMIACSGIAVRRPRVERIARKL